MYRSGVSRQLPAVYTRAMSTSHPNRVAPLRTAIVGAGRIAGKHLAAIAALPHACSLAALCDHDAAVAARAAQTAGLAPSRIYNDVATMLRECPLDAVIICTPHACHHAAARARH